MILLSDYEWQCTIVTFRLIYDERETFIIFTGLQQVRFTLQNVILTYAVIEYSRFLIPSFDSNVQDGNNLNINRIMQAT